MGIKAIVDAIDTVEEGHRGLYVQKDGKFVLDVDPVGGFALEDVTGLQAALASERTLTTVQEKELKKFGSTWDKTNKKWEHSLDPVKAKQALDKYDEFMALDPAKEADKIAETKIRSATDQLVAQHTGELTARDGRITKLGSKVNSLLVTQQAKTEIVALKGEPDLLIPHIERQTRVRETDDDFIVEIIDKEGNVRIGDAKGNPMTLAQLVAEMRESPIYGRAFEGDGKTGTGKGPGTGGGGNPSGLKRSTMTPQQKAEYQEKHGQSAFLQLPR